MPAELLEMPVGSHGVDPVAAAPQHTIRVVTRPAELGAWADAWQQLADAAGLPTADYIWSQSCLATIDRAKRLHLLAVERDGHLAALAPLTTARVRGIGRLVSLGVSDLHEPSDLLAEDGEALARLTKAILRTGRPLVLDRLPADSPTIAAIERAAQGRAKVLVRERANCPYIELDSNWLEPEQQLNSGRRSDLRRARRKAEQLGPVTIEILSPSAGEVAPLFDEAIAVESKSWKGDAGTALACDRAKAEFFRDYVARACQVGTLRMAFLRIGEKAAAMQIAVQQADGFWLLKVGYDAEFAACSPGLLLMRDTIRHATQQGLGRYEFLGRAEAWTAVWTKTESATVSLRVYPYNARGAAALAADSLAAAIRRRKPS